MSNERNQNEKSVEQLESELLGLKLAYETLKQEFENESLHKNQVINTLKESENYYQILYHNTPANYQSLDANACFTDVNQAWLQTMGYTREEVIGHNFSEFMSPESVGLIKSRFPYFKSKGRISDFEFELIRKDGSQILVSFDGTITYDDDGNFRQTNCVWTEITNRKQAEKSNRIKDLAIESAINAIAISDLDGNLTYVNPAFYKLWGYNSHTEVLGKNAVTFWHAGEKASEVIEALRNEGGWIGELTAIHKDGTLLDIEVSASMVKDDSGEPICMLASFSDVTRRKQAEISQAENEISYRELFNNVAYAIYIQDKNGTFLDVNEGAVKMYGYPREALIGKGPSFVSAPDKNNLAQIEEMLERAFLGEPQQFEFWGMRSNGQIFPKEVRILNGTYYGKKVLIALAQDITERKLAESALQNSERRYRELIELAVDGILLGSPDGIIIGANSYMQNLTGRYLDDLIGINIKELFSSNTVKNIPLRYDLLRKGQTVFNERELLQPNGKIVPVEMHTKMMPDGTYQSIFRDITERKKAEETLRESETKFKSLVESTSDIIWETNIEGNYTYVSPQFESLLGYPPEEVLGKSPFAFICDENLSEIIKHSDSIINNSTHFSSLVNNYKHNNGTIHYFETSGVPVFGSKGILTGYRGVSRDITKRYLAEKELLNAKEKAEASDKLKSAFIQNISHELRTPLNGIIGFSEMLTHMDNSEEDRIEFNKMIRKSSARLINTITNYIDISMIVSGITEINMHPFLLSHFLDKIKDQTFELFNSHNLTLNIKDISPKTDVQLITDENLLTKIFLHLIDNAIKFTKAGSISIGHETRSGFHHFSISDTGQGISQESLSAIFEIFTQADLSISRGYEGSGLGLSITRGFIKLLGGDVWVESKNNEGSTFYFTIPEKSPVNNPSYKLNTVKSISEDSQPVILVAEDDDSSYKYLELVLKKASFSILRATNGYETVEISRKHPEIKVLITDLKMPGMDGFEATRQIKMLFPDLPIIVLSAYASSGDEIAATSAGCDAYIVKPVSKELLLATINKLLNPSNI